MVSKDTNDFPEADTETRDKRVERLQIMVTDNELVALDEWRFAAHMPSRSAAVRELMRRGLEAEGYFSKASHGNSSATYGIIKPK